MQTTRIVQAVFLVMIVAVGASCAASKEYSSKLFSPRNENAPDSQAIALRFLELDSLQSEKDGWVTTDIIMGRDTVSKTLALDKLAKVFPAVSATKEPTTKSKEERTAPAVAETKPMMETKPMVETKPIQTPEQPMAKNYDPTEVRNKKTRD